jgi:hypothetical protein
MDLDITALPLNVLVSALVTGMCLELISSIEPETIRCRGDSAELVLCCEHATS